MSKPHNDYEGLCIGGPLDGQTKRSRWNHFNEQLPTATTVARPDGYALAPGEHSANPDSANYRHVELWAASFDEVEKTRYGFWVPEESFADSHRYLFAAMVAAYEYGHKPRVGVHKVIAEQTGLAACYAEDGAFNSAANVLYDLANKVSDHAHWVNPQSPKPGKRRPSNIPRIE